MVDTKTLTRGALLTGLAVLFQIIPVVFTEAFSFATMLSALPVYVATRINRRTGLIAYLAAAVLIVPISVHEGLFFLFTNGILGFTLGIAYGLTTNKIMAPLAATPIFAASLAFMNFVIGIPISGTKIPGSLGIALLLILCFAFFYASIYLYFANWIVRMLARYDK